MDAGIEPVIEVFEARPDGSRNLGERDYYAMAELRPKPEYFNPDGKYLLLRIGDALTSRDTHAGF